MVADANYGVPLAHVVTTAKRPDTSELPGMIAHAEALHDWWKPDVVIADRGRLPVESRASDLEGHHPCNPHQGQCP